MDTNSHELKQRKGRIELFELVTPLGGTLTVFKRMGCGFIHSCRFVSIRG